MSPVLAVLTYYGLFAATIGFCYLVVSLIARSKR